MKNRRMLPGCHAPNAAAPGDATTDPTNDAEGATGSPLLTAAAAGAAVRDAPFSSRRLAANAVHASGAAAGESPVPPEANHANTSEPTPRTPPAAAAARGAVITGTDTTGADTTGADTAAGADAANSETATDSSTTAGAESLPPTGATTEARDGTDTSCEPGLTPTTAGATTTPARRSRALSADAPCAPPCALAAPMPPATRSRVSTAPCPAAPPPLAASRFWKVPAHCRAVTVPARPGRAGPVLSGCSSAAPHRRRPSS